jgi:hypothetical protein
LEAEDAMSDKDPWSRPTLKDLQDILENLHKPDTDNRRNVDRLELSVPAEIVTARGNTVAAMTREISRSGIGILHRGSISPGEVTIKMAGDSQTFEYRVVIEWCTPCDNGMFMSGGRFLPKSSEATT